MTKNTKVKIITAGAAAVMMFAIGLVVYWTINGLVKLRHPVSADPASVFAQKRETTGRAWPHKWEGDIIFKGKHLPYTYRKYYDDSEMEGAFEILRETRVVYSMPIYDSRGGVEVGLQLSGDGSGGIDKSLRAIDLDRDGVPNLVLHQATGGKVLCCNTYVLSLGESVKEVVSFESIFESVEFKDIDGDGKFEVLTKDWSLSRDEGLWTDYPTAAVILEFTDGNYKFSKRLMQRGQAKLYASELVRFKQEIRHTGRAPRELLETIIAMIYSGKGDEALSTFYNLFEDGSGGIEFTDYILDNLARSEYWQDIKELNHWDTPEAEKRLARYNMGC